MRVKISRWDIYEELATEEDIKSWVDVANEEVKKDNDLDFFAHCLEIAAEARRRLAAKNEAKKSRRLLTRIRAMISPKNRGGMARSPADRASVRA
jgi:hypothetical protein